MNYDEFIASKQKKHIQAGFEISEAELNPQLFPFQKHCVKKAILNGRFALFEDCGLGKTFQQLEFAHQVSKHEDKPVLILCPLAVAGQTIKEGETFGYHVSRYTEGIKPEYGLWISNYEQLDNIDCSVFCGVVLDESSILKNFDGKYRTLIIEKFRETPYKLACTATPSPNDPMELGNHSEFLGIMSRNEMLSMYFIHDGGNTSKWRIKRHGIKSFYDWVATWAIMISKPSDIGFKNEGYELPPLNFIEEEIKTPKQENGLLFNTESVSAIDFNKQLRITLIPRLDLVADLVNESDDNFIVWVKQNQEQDYISKLIPDALTVQGSDKPEVKEKRLLGFAANEFRVLITKQKIAQFGLNYQNCNNQVFPSLDFSFEGLYQAIRRSWRFGQDRPVNIYLVTTDTMKNVVDSIKRKQDQFEKMQNQMRNAMNQAMKERVDINQEQIEEITTDEYTIRRGDCVRLIRQLPDESVSFSIFSPPFAELYTYSDHIEDMGNSKDYKEFLEHFKYLSTELYRVLWSGRNIAIHCMDLPIQKGKEGYIGLRDFSGMIKETFEDAGFIYHSRVTIWKDPVTEMQRTKALGLLHKQLKKDSTMSRAGIPDYLMIFRKDGERENPVLCDLPVEKWQKYASPVWMDINYSDTLQFRTARDEKDEKHICPLQLPTIERAIKLYTNPGDTVLSPFAGIGSEGYKAIEMGRKFIGFELKKSYFDLMAKNMKNVTELQKQIELF